MSQENVELVRRLYALLDQGDQEAFLERVAPDFVVDFSRRLIDPVVLRGHDQMKAWGALEREMWEGPTNWDPKKLVDTGDQVLAFIRTGGRGKASGVQVEAHVWNVWTFREGLPVQWQYFGDDRASALEAVGLSEQDAHADS